MDEYKKALKDFDKQLALVMKIRLKYDIPNDQVEKDLNGASMRAIMLLLEDDEYNELFEKKTNTRK